VNPVSLEFSSVNFYNLLPKLQLGKAFNVNPVSLEFSSVNFYNLLPKLQLGKVVRHLVRL
jgi:hypothetical protein